MKVAFGLKPHSGWAALVVLGQLDRDFVVVDRRRIELVEHPWAKQPYHAAEHLEPDEARAVVKQGIEEAKQGALRELRDALKRERKRENVVAACAVLTGNPMPDWSVDEILAVHFRMHKAEGVLFRDVLVQAVKKCEVKLVAVPEKQLAQHAETGFGNQLSEAQKKLAAAGKAAGAPWAKDQRDAALAAMIALHSSK